MAVQVRTAGAVETFAPDGGDPVDVRLHLSIDGDPARLPAHVHRTSGPQRGKT
ncbi:hypothetical protein [uncultured Roseibium sp.]|uniref:hypothetical protein n=1 Tax=uncultured Roseibium sp. TaxID=1936171 RepID=UPI00321646A3